MGHSNRNLIRERRNEEAGLPLKLSLKPGEKFVLNGAVVQNGDRRGVLVLQNKASVLREKDIMQEERGHDAGAPRSTSR